MKRLLFAAYSLDLGGIETALVTLLNYLKKEGHEITLVLEKKEGIFLDELDKEITVIEYRPSEHKNILKRKQKNLEKRLNFAKEYKNKFDFAASFATYSLVSSFVARTASQNCALWCHADYLTLFNGDIPSMKRFFDDLNYKEFKHIIFVSEEGKQSFLKVFPKMKDIVISCNNLIDYQKIIQKSKEKIELEKTKEITFLNLGRHDEKQKRLSRLIEASKKLSDDNYRFRVLFVGEGPDTDKYKKMVLEKGLGDKLIFCGAQKNPYPYFKISDCAIITSDYEGFPVVFIESFVLEKPIITTNVSDSKEQVEGKFGMVTEKSVEDIYEKMKLFMLRGYQMKEKFDPEVYNKQIIRKLEEIF